jgi:hypothetical protein
MANLISGSRKKQEKELMRQRYLAVFLMTVLACATAQVQAGEWYFGGKLAYFEIDVADVDDPDNAGLVVSYDWDIKHGSVGVEGEFTTTFLDGEFATQKVELDTAGLYGVYRTRGPATKGMGPYLKLKAGAAYSDLTIGDSSEDDTNFSAGIGLGVNMAFTSFELEYTTIADDIEMISLLIRF